MRDDTLLLYYYQDGLTEDERYEVETALRDDPAVAARYRDLRGDLAQAGDLEVGDPTADMVQRFHDTIDRAARLEAGRAPREPRSFSVMSFVWGATVTAALALGIGIGVYFAGDETAAPIVPIDPGVVPDIADTGAFTRALQVHLRYSQNELARLQADADVERNLLLYRIIEQNRLFERSAEQNNSSDLARVLRAFELILVQLAAEDISSEDAAALQAKLAFELNVMLTKLSRDASVDETSI